MLYDCDDLRPHTQKVECSELEAKLIASKVILEGVSHGKCWTTANYYAIMKRAFSGKNVALLTEEMKKERPVIIIDRNTPLDYDLRTQHPELSILQPFYDAIKECDSRTRLSVFGIYHLKPDNPKDDCDARIANSGREVRASIRSLSTQLSGFMRIMVITGNHHIINRKGECEVPLMMGALGQEESSAVIIMHQPVYEMEKKGLDSEGLYKLLCPTPQIYLHV